jgi:hypothetical protein
VKRFIYKLFIILLILVSFTAYGFSSSLFEAGTIVGKVYLDKNENGLHDNDEEGISGAVIRLNNGITVTTGTGGKFSIPGLPGGFYVLELDDWTLPPGIILISPEEQSKFLNLPDKGMALINFRVKEDI